VLLSERVYAPDALLLINANSGMDAQTYWRCVGGISSEKYAQLRANEKKKKHGFFVQHCLEHVRALPGCEFASGR